MCYLKKIEGNRGSMTFNGKATTDFNLVVQTVPNYTFSEKEVEITHIPGKNGDTIYETGAYLNTSRTYNLAGLFDNQTTLENGYAEFVNACSSIVSWLSNTTGYRELMDSYEPEYYRLAKYVSAGEIVNIRDQALMMEVEFNCKPQRYLIVGKNEYDITESVVVTEKDENGNDIKDKDGNVVIKKDADGNVVTEPKPKDFKNPTNYTAKPLIIVKNYTIETGKKTLCTCKALKDDSLIKTIDIVLNIVDKTSLPSSAVDVYIDSETENVYAIDSNDIAYSLNFAIDLNFEFINMEPNLSYKFTSEYTNYTVKVKPRWWTL